MIRTGGCLCGRIRYVVQGDPGPMVHCYCSMCRRNGGTGLQTFVRFERRTLRPLGDHFSWYRSSARAARAFCPECGSSLAMAYQREPDHVWITAGTLDEADDLAPNRHCRAQDRVPWISSTLDVPGT